MFKKKPAPAYRDTPAERHASINMLAAVAVSHFEDAILSLDEAARQHDEHAYALHAQIEELKAVRDASDRDAASATAVADRLRNLVA